MADLSSSGNVCALKQGEVQLGSTRATVGSCVFVVVCVDAWGGVCIAVTVFSCPCVCVAYMRSIGNGVFALADSEVKRARVCTIIAVGPRHGWVGRWCSRIGGAGLESGYSGVPFPCCPGICVTFVDCCVICRSVVDGQYQSVFLGTIVSIGTIV